MFGGETMLFFNEELFNKCEEFKNNPNFACIVLDEDVRSSTSKMFANLFKV